MAAKMTAKRSVEFDFYKNNHQEPRTILTLRGSASGQPLKYIPTFCKQFTHARVKRGVALIKTISDAADYVSESVIAVKRERLSANDSASA